MGDTTPNPHERRAQALAEVTQMQVDLVTANKRVQELEATLLTERRDFEYQTNLLKDRCALNEEERGKYRAEAMLYRGKLLMICLADSCSSCACAGSSLPSRQ